MSDQKIYFGNAKEITGNYGAFHRISFSKKDLEEMLNNLNEKGYININMNRRQSPSQYGHTHSLTLDTWQPNQQSQPSAQAVQQFQQGQHPQHQAPVNPAPDFSEPAKPDFDALNEDCPF